jgi:hypothetical protein
LKHLADYGTRFRDFSKHTATTVDEWSSILDISAQWAFESIQSLAIEQLTFLASPVDKIVMGRKHKVDKWLPDAYRDVCERERTLTLEEGLRLGMPEVIKISHARQAIRKDARLVALHRIDLVIEETFGLGVVPDPSAAMALETPEPSKRALEREEASLRVVESLRSISPPFSDKLGDPPSDWKIPVPATPKSPTFLPVPATPSPTFLPVPATPSPTFLPVPATPSPTFLPALRLNDDEMNYRYVTKAPTIDIDRHETSPPPERPPVKNNKGKKKGRKVVLESVDTSEMY